VTSVIGLAADVGWMHGGFGRDEGPAPRSGLSGAVDRILQTLDDYTVDFLAADAGSTDAGPYFLGAAETMTHRLGIAKSFEAVLPIALSRGIPLLIGSCAMAGTSAGVRLFRTILAEVADGLGLHCKVALIESEPSRDLVVKRLNEGRVHRLPHAPQLTPDDIAAASSIVAMQGTEPLQVALNEGAQVVLSGRVSDSALFAAVPVSQGVPLAAAWHMAKVIDHGFTNLRPVKGVVSSVVGIAEMDGFTVQAAHQQAEVDAIRVAQATVYENSSPVLLREPPGTLDTSRATYLQLDPRTVRVTGSAFRLEPYTVKLEGATRIGDRSISVCAIRDPKMMAQLDPFLAAVGRAVETQAAAQGLSLAEFRLMFRRYGTSGVMRDWEPDPDRLSNEVCVLTEVVADTQDIAHGVMNMANRELLHRGYPGRQHASGNVAFPYSPLVIDCGPAFRFSVWHAMELDDPMETCSITYAMV
jgi:Acyclic terpene utilisation family protein AtuA